MTTVIGNGITTTPGGNFLLGCKDKNPPVPGTILHWLVNQKEFSIFTNLVYKAGLQNQLNNCGETLTLFVPPDYVLERCINKVRAENPRIFVSSHVLRNKFSIHDFDRSLFQTKDLFGKDSVIDARDKGEGDKTECAIYYGKAKHSLTFSLDWISRGTVAEYEVCMVNGYVHFIDTPIFTCME